MPAILGLGRSAGRLDCEPPDPALASPYFCKRTAAVLTWSFACPPSVGRLVTSCCYTRTCQPGMLGSAGENVYGGCLMMTSLSGSVAAGLSAIGPTAPAAGAPVRLQAMSGRKNASILSPHRVALPRAKECDVSSHVISRSATGRSEIKVALKTRPA